MYFEVFKQFHGTGRLWRTPTQDELAACEGSLSEQMVGDWRKNGWRCFLDGLIWFINPADYAPMLKDWLERPERFVPFARTSFGDLFLADERMESYVLDVHSGGCRETGGGDVDYFVDFTLTSEPYLRDMLRFDLHKKALAKLGELQESEMYAFVPALALGGDEELPYVRIEKLFPQLGILSQLRE